MNKALTTTAMTGFPVAGIAAGLYFAKDFMWQFAYNLAVPFSVFTVLAMLVCAIAIKSGYDLMRHSDKASEDYAIAEWRCWTAINFIAIVGVLWVSIMAVPSPNFKKEIITQYRTRVVEKPIVKWKYEKEHVVYHTPTYEDAFKLCTSAGSDNGVRDKPTTEECHKLATEASLPPYRTINRTVMVHDSYADMFNKCMDHWQFSDIRVEQAASLINSCKAYALKR